MIELFSGAIEKGIEKAVEKEQTFFDKFEASVEATKSDIEKKEESIKAFWSGLENGNFAKDMKTNEKADNDSQIFKTDGERDARAQTDTGGEDRKPEADVEKQDPFAEKIARIIGTPEGIKELIEKHPEKAELWKSQLAIETLNDPEASPAEIRSAQAKLSNLKGQIMEVAVKDTFADAGFDVETQQRVVAGESGGTRPDVIAVNNTDHPIEALGSTIQPGETLSAECKCGGSSYMTNQLKNHIPNQLSGQEGTKLLITTSDVNEAPDGLAANVCDKYEAKLLALNVSVSDVEKAIKEVS